MRRSPSIITALGLLGLTLFQNQALAGNPIPPVLSGTVNQAPFSPQGTGSVGDPFPGTSLVDPGSPTAKTPGPEVEGDGRDNPSLPSTSPPPQGADSQGTHEKAEGQTHRSLGNLFELQRQEALLKREISIRKLKDQLKGPGTKKILETGGKGSPVTLLAAGFEGKRYAILEWNDGRRIRVLQGETLPDGSRVVRIDGSGVSVRKRGGVRTYPYGQSLESHNGGGYPPLSFQGGGGSGFMPPPPPPSIGGHP